MSSKTLTFTEASLVEALNGVLGLHDMSRELIAEQIFANAPAPSGEVEAVEVVAYLPTDAERGIGYDGKGGPALWIGPPPKGEKLMTVAQHQRLREADRAEIARLKAEVQVKHEAAYWAERRCDDMGFNATQWQEEAQTLKSERMMVVQRNVELIAERDELRAQLAAQQAAVPVPDSSEAPSRVEAAIVAIRDLWDEDECPAYPPVAKVLRELLTTTAAPQQGMVMTDRLNTACTLLREVMAFRWVAECSEHRARVRRQVDNFLNADRSAQPITSDFVQVPRELMERYVSDVEAHGYGFNGDDEMRALIDRSAQGEKP